MNLMSCMLKVFECACFYHSFSWCFVFYDYFSLIIIYCLLCDKYMRLGICGIEFFFIAQKLFLIILFLFHVKLSEA